MPYPPTFDHPWDITQPPDTQLANLLGLDIRNLKDDIMQRITSLAGTFANRPTPETINATWGGTGFGLLYFSLDTNKVYQWNGSSWVDVTSSIGGGGIALQTNGVANAVQNLLNLVAGSGVTLTAGGAGDVTIASSGGGGGGVPIQVFGNKLLASPVTAPNNTLTLVDSITVTFPGSGGPWRVLGSYHYWINGGLQWQASLFDGANWFAQSMKIVNNQNSMVSSTDMSPVTYANGAVVTFATYLYSDAGGTVVLSAPQMGSPGRVTAMGVSHMDVSVFASN